MRELKTLKGIDVQGKHVLLRSEVNVPIKDGLIENSFRLKKALRTLIYLREAGAKVIVIGHIWGDEITTLAPVAEYFRQHFPVTFVERYRNGEAKEVIDGMTDGEVVMFENLRLHEGEKTNNSEFAQELSSYADLYVFDAFPVAHRDHASVVGIPQYVETVAGFQFADEYDHLSKAFEPDHPFLFVLGGAKFETKLPVVEKFLETADHVYLAGALMMPVLKARGYEVGKSLMPEKEIDLTHLTDNPKLITPRDVVTAEGNVKKVNEVEASDVILDIGPESLRELVGFGKSAKFILWNGPLGDYERGFGETTDEFARSLAECNCTSILGGGDTIAAVEKHGIEDGFTFVSTAGGAMLEFLSTETLPVLEYLKR